MARLRKLFDCLRHPVSRRAVLRHRVAAATEHACVLAGLQPDFVVDIGANRGQFALCCLATCDRATIVSFEPLEAPARTFREVMSGQGRVSLHAVAVGPARRRASMHLSARDDSSSLLSISPAQVAVFPGTGEIGTVTVDERRLGDCMSRDDVSGRAMLKIDVQGYELECLKGCEDLLDLFLWVYVECSFVQLYRQQPLAHEVLAWLKERGFRLEALFNPYVADGSRVIQADLLFSNVRSSSDS